MPTYAYCCVLKSLTNAGRTRTATTRAANPTNPAMRVARGLTRSHPLHLRPPEQTGRADEKDDEDDQERRREPQLLREPVECAVLTQVAEHVQEDAQDEPADDRADRR